MNSKQLDELQSRALDAAITGGSTEQIANFEKAANVLKQISDVKKSSYDSENQPKLLRYEEFKAWAALLVPLASVVTLAFTIWIQQAQIQATREANEDTEWRDTVKNVLAQINRPNGREDPATALTLLSSYMESGRHVRDAQLLSIHVLSRVPTSDPFADFFATQRIGSRWEDVQLLTSTNRTLWSDLNEADHGTPNANISQDLKDSVRSALFSEIKLTSQLICSLYKSNTSKAENADLSRVFLVDCDLSGLTFSNADFSETKLQGVNLVGTSWGEHSNLTDTLFVDSNWWDARVMPQSKLKELIEQHYPYYDPTGVTYDREAPPDKEKYSQIVLALCSRSNVVCAPGSVKYGQPVPTSETPSAVAGAAVVGTLSSGTPASAKEVKAVVAK